MPGPKKLLPALLLLACGRSTPGPPLASAAPPMDSAKPVPAVSAVNPLATIGALPSAVPPVQRKITCLPAQTRRRSSGDTAHRSIATRQNETSGVVTSQRSDL